MHESLTSTDDLAALDREIASLDAAPLPTTQTKQPHEEGEEEAEDVENVLMSDGTGAADLHRRLAWRRAAMLGCACCLSIGSHYATYTLGPIKKSLGTSEGGFAALISAFELLNTVTPLVSGFLVPRFGAAACGLVATGSVLLGQVIVCLAQSGEGGVSGHLGGMVIGLLIFGAGISPLAVVQETIILKHNSSSSRSTARAVALGLVLGKTASFAAGWSSDRLHSISPRLPFITAAALALFSFSACVLYAATERSTSRLVANSASSSVAASEELPTSKHYQHDTKHPHRPLHLSALASFGDPFWLYIAVCALAGMWYTTNHLASHFLQSVYLIPQKEASGRANLLLATSTFLYPVIGWALDKRPSLLSKLWLAVPILTATTYSILLFLSAAIPPTVALLPAALGMGSGPLLLVLVVPRLVERHQAATALGAHKSLEMAGAIIYQSICGLLLSLGKNPTPDEGEEEEEEDNADYALFFLLTMALVMVGVVARWWAVIQRREEEKRSTLSEGEQEEGTARGRERDDAEYGLLEPGAATDESDLDETSPSRGGEGSRRERSVEEDTEERGTGEMGRKEREELGRGKKALRAAAGVVLLSWVCFVVNLVFE